MKENKENLKPVVGLQPFRKFCMSIGELPTSYLETMTYYEMLVWFIEYMKNTVIPTINNNAEAIEELQDKYIEFTDFITTQEETFEENITNSFNELQTYVNDYFDNLDVQEEINNKLDDMVENGTLEQIISQFIGYFNTVNDMKNASNLTQGSLAKTYGYYSINDGGGSDYYITNRQLSDIEDGGTTIFIGDNLTAHLLYCDQINIRQFGAYGDNSHDDTTAIQNALKLNENNFLKIKFNENSIYLCQGNIFLYSNTHIDLQNSTIKSCSIEYSTNYNGLQLMNNVDSVEEYGYGAIKNIKIENGTLDGDTSGISILLFHSENCIFENLIFNKCFVATHIFDLGGCKDTIIKNCKFIGYMVNLEANNYREMIQPDYARSSSVPYWNGYTTPAFDNLPTINLYVDNCSFEIGNGIFYPNAIGTHAIGDLPHENINITNCIFKGCNYSSIRLPRVKNLLIQNNTFYDLQANRSTDRFVIDLKALVNYDYEQIPSDNIRIIGNDFILKNNLNGTVNAINCQSDNSNGIIGTISIINNYFNSNFIPSVSNYGGDVMQIANINNLIFNDNICENMKNIIIKNADTKMNNLFMNNNHITDCRTFTRSFGTADTEPKTNFIESNNIWTRGENSINVNDFVVKFTIEEDTTIDSDGVSTLMFVSDNPFITINNQGIISIPEFIRSFSYEISALINTSTQATREAHSYIQKNGNNINEEYNISNEATEHYIKVPTSYFKQDILINNATVIVPRATLKQNDVILKERTGNFPGTYITIKGCN